MQPKKNLGIRISAVGTLLCSAALLGPGFAAAETNSEPADWQPPTPQVLEANQTRLGLIAQPEQFAKNGGFEEHKDGWIASWSRSLWPMSEETKGVAERVMHPTSELAFEGSAALEVDMSQGGPHGRTYVLRQVLPVEAVRGKRLRFSVRSLIQTMPNPDGDPVHLVLRQYGEQPGKGRVLLSVSEARSYNDTGRWTLGALETQIRPDVVSVDVKLHFANPLPTGIPCVYVVDALSVASVEPPLLEVALPRQEVSQAAAWLPLRCTVAERAAAHGELRLVQALCREGQAVRVRALTVAASFLGEPFEIEGLSAGAYELVSVLEAGEAGPIAMSRSPVRIYAGPFAEVTP